MTDDFTLLDVTSLGVTDPDALRRDPAVLARRERLLAPRQLSTLQDPRRGALRYQASQRLRIAINTALTLEMPLLVAGEPGTGKTQVAWFLAAAFGLSEPEVLAVRSTTTAQDLLYTFDAVGDFRDAQERDDIERNRARHVHPGPFWRALQSAEPRVILVDEVDKAPRDFPNDLLDVLDRFEFPVPELARLDEEDVRATFRDKLTCEDGRWVVRAAPERRRPIVVLTTNSERRLPEPFLRRCIFHTIVFDQALVKQAVEARRADYPNLPVERQQEAITSFMRLREASLRKLPSTAELLNWLRALDRREDLWPELSNVPGRLPLLEALIKTREDLEILRAL